ncbi:TDT family transporter [Lentilactobacillus sp. Marseille-Q4993]|uniref:TDT family transporter n=1 Tax=Lentilactobacillus sp. Marseille-Q4993 TaxID=3039492 RepID=UPI0024BD1464|nr:TDT family transporter [Lentilactobacillus sp. Marseille-Q4993]
MKTLLKQIPLPICGLALGILSLGNLLNAFNLTTIGTICGIIGLIIVAGVTGKVVFTFKHVLNDLNDPIIASVAPTYTMAIMILSTFIKTWFGSIIATTRWTAAVILQFVIIGLFVYIHMLKPSVQLDHVYPSWFVTFIGIGVIPVTATKFIPVIGMPVLILALVLYAILLPIVIVRLLRRELPFEATLPLLTIMAAPASLCLTGYLSMVTHPTFWFALVMVVLAQILYWGTLAKIVRYVRLSFYPSFAAFTFPLVISATALNLFVSKFSFSASLTSFLHGAVILETVLASAMVAFVLVKYTIFLTEKFAGSMKKETMKTSH